ncbi:hypothetical protein, partial [Mesorhizobium sp. M7A.F.Ca.AU.002.06.1.1]|uniref:hypothetical protein n=1 Tax=Mesorhizobium sp. M7A.F.Ca.AU.002.06.1.1 TaxID=2496674 RepID=UPI0019D223BF
RQAFGQSHRLVALRRCGNREERPPDATNRGGPDCRCARSYRSRRLVTPCDQLVGVVTVTQKMIVPTWPWIDAM